MNVTLYDDLSEQVNKLSFDERLKLIELIIGTLQIEEKNLPRPILLHLIKHSECGVVRMCRLNTSGRKLGGDKIGQNLFICE